MHIRLKNQLRLDALPRAGSHAFHTVHLIHFCELCFMLSCKVMCKASVKLQGQFSPLEDSSMHPHPAAPSFHFLVFSFTYSASTTVLGKKKPDCAVLNILIIYRKGEKQWGCFRRLRLIESSWLSRWKWASPLRSLSRLSAWMSSKAAYSCSALAEGSAVIGRLSFLCLFHLNTPKYFLLWVNFLSSGILWRNSTQHLQFVLW